MDSVALAGLTVLVAEDEYMLASDLANELAEIGIIVLGPVSSLEAAIDLIEQAYNIDAAILDVSLMGDTVFPAADILTMKGVPFLFATGYDQSVIPERFANILRCEKPIDPRDLGRVLTTIIANLGLNPCYTCRDRTA